MSSIVLALEIAVITFLIVLLIRQSKRKHAKEEQEALKDKSNKNRQLEDILSNPDKKTDPYV